MKVKPEEYRKITPLYHVGAKEGEYAGKGSLLIKERSYQGWENNF